MKNLMIALTKVLGLVLIALYFTACGQAGSGGASTKIDDGTVDNPVAPIADVVAPINPNLLPAVDPSSPSNIVLTYYKRTEVDSPVDGWVTKTVSLTGNCVTYQSKTYCWDNGIKTIDFTANHFHFGPFTYSYFGIGSNPNGSFGHCWGGCPNDIMTQPTFISPLLSLSLQQSIGTEVNTVAQVFSAGTPVQVNCALSNGYLNCIDFAIDLNQVAL